MSVYRRCNRARSADHIDLQGNRTRHFLLGDPGLRIVNLFDNSTNWLAYGVDYRLADDLYCLLGLGDRVLVFSNLADRA